MKCPDNADNSVKKPHKRGGASYYIRTDKLRSAGFRVLRFWNHEVLGQLEAVKEKIWLELQVEPHPHPDPLPPINASGASSEGEEIRDG